MSKCIHCGEEHSAEAKYCPVTGKTIKSAADSKQKNAAKNSRKWWGIGIGFILIASVSSIFTVFLLIKFDVIRPLNTWGFGSINNQNNNTDVFENETDPETISDILPSEQNYSETPTSNSVNASESPVTSTPGTENTEEAIPTEFTSASLQDWVVFEKWNWDEENESWGYTVELWAIKADGSDLHPIITSGRNLSPSWSPDGNYIAFSRYERNIFQGLAIIKPDGSDLQEITHQWFKDSYPNWISNDQILFTSPRGSDEEYSDSWRLITLSMDTMTENILDVGFSGAFAPVVSPDKQFLAFSATADKENKIILISDIYGQNVLPLITDTEEIQGYPHTWSHDSEYLILNDQHQRCLKVSLDGNIEILIQGVNECNITWSSDGAYAVYQFNAQIWRMDADGNNKFLLFSADDNSRLRNPVWSP